MSIHGSRRRGLLTGPVSVVIVSITGALAFAELHAVKKAAAEERSQYRFETVSLGDVVQQIRASGRLDAVATVYVSSQLSGQIVELLADFNDQVRRGQPLARLDDKTLIAKVNENRAKLANAHAILETAKAETAGAAARFEEARKDFERRTSLRSSGTASERDLEGSRSRMLSTESSLAAAKATETVRYTEIQIAEALLQQAQIDLERSVIKAPIDGVVIERNVELGQTVAVSLQAPNLFNIAKDLGEMEVKAFIDEADIGRIKTGQPVVFRVDAHRDEIFHGRVTSVRRAPRLIENVTTYTVVIAASNPKALLLPGMTADVQIILASRRNVMRVPLSALHFRPAQGSLSSSISLVEEREQGRNGAVWLATPQGGLKSVTVEIGVANDLFVEIRSEDLRPGDRIAIGHRSALQ